MQSKNTYFEKHLKFGVFVKKHIAFSKEVIVSKLTETITLFLKIIITTFQRIEKSILSMAINNSTSGPKIYRHKIVQRTIVLPKHLFLNLTKTFLL